jgi:thiamine biosynthesis lipoprotein
MPEPHTFQHVEYCMGTAFVFEGRSPLGDSATASLLVNACEILHEADRTFSLYKPESPLSRLARGETSVAECPPVVDEIWVACEKWSEVTDGWFSAFTPQHTFDPSGLVKTWAARSAAEYLIGEGIVDFTVNAGGDIWLSDNLTNRVDFRVGISKPVSIASQDAGVLTVLDLHGTPFRAVATSGTAERGEHIWNPKSGLATPASELAQVSVVARDIVAADVWATAAFAMSDRAVSTLNRYNELNPLQSVQALLVWPDGNLTGTDGIINLLAKPEED